jgi:uncharacterized protein
MKMFTGGNGFKYDFDEVMEEIVTEAKLNDVAIMVGTDSQNHKEHTTFVTAVVCHRVGRGARLFYVRDKVRRINSVRERMLREAELSIQVALEYQNYVDTQYPELNDCIFEVHADVNAYPEHESNRALKEIVGWITGCGFVCKIKPDAPIASTVADKYAIMH